MPASKYAKARAKVVETVIAGLRQGTPLTVICSAQGMPCDDTVRNWADADPALFRDIVRARDAGFDAIASRTRQTARGEGDSKQDVQRDKLIIETDLKLLAKWDKRYADRQTFEHTGKDGGPIQHEQVEADAAAFRSRLVSQPRPGEAASGTGEPVQ